MAMTIKWMYDTGRCVDASPLVAMGDQAPPTVYIGSHSGMFVALCVLSGRCLWEVQLSDRIESSACLLLLNGTHVVVGTLRNNLRIYVVRYLYVIFRISPQGLPCGLVVRIPGFHPGGPGSIPGMGTFFSYFAQAFDCLFLTFLFKNPVPGMGIIFFCCLKP